MPSNASLNDAELHQLATGVWAWVQPDGTWWINNAGAVSDGREAFVIDTCATEERTRRFLDALSAASKGVPIRAAVNTHQHGDHTYGNSLLPTEAMLVGHPQMRQGLLDDPLIDGCPPIWDPVPDWGNVTKRVPNLTIRTEMEVHVGDIVIELRHPGYAAHTNGDLIAWLPAERILFTGDLVFAGLTPLVFMGSVDGALHAIDWLAQLGPDVVVPGHGPVVRGEQIESVFEQHRRYYRFVNATAAQGRADALAPLAAAQRCELGEFAGWADAERLVLNLHRAYADATGNELNPLEAMLDAMAYNGGPLTTHVCS